MDPVLRSQQAVYWLRKDGELVLCVLQRIVTLKSALYFADESSMSYQDADVV
jgi:hypothetical protein